MSELLIAVFASLGWAILHSLWIALLAAGAYGLLSKCFPHQLNLRYQAGGFALMTILVSGVGVFLSALSEHWPSALAQMHSQTLALPTLHADVGRLETGGPSVWTMLLGLVWLLGAALSAWRLWRSHCALRTLAQQSVFSGALHELALQLSIQLRLRLPVRVAISEWIDVPCVIGLLKPLILVPSALVARLPADQMELILLHELSHVKNGDLWVNALQILIEVVMFFHPAVHWISADLRALRERRCDRSVLEVRPIPVRYAQTLLRLEEFRQEFRGLAIAASGGELSTRVRDILMPRLNTPGASRSSQGAALLSAVAMTALLAGSVTQVMVPPTLEEVTPEKSADALLTPQSPRVELTPRADLPIRTTHTDMASPKLSLPEQNLEVLDTTAAQERTLERARLALRSASIRSGRKPIQLASLGDVDLSSFTEPAMPSDPLASAPIALPKLIRQVNPVFHAGSEREYQFSMSFQVDAKGQPREIRFEKGNATETHIEAASLALAKWRFDPRGSAQFGSKRMEQAFNFKEVERPCVQVIGSRICRRVAR